MGIIYILFKFFNNIVHITYTIVILFVLAINYIYIIDYYNNQICEIHIITYVYIHNNKKKKCDLYLDMLVKKYFKKI